MNCKFCNNILNQSRYNTYYLFCSSCKPRINYKDNNKVATIYKRDIDKDLSFQYNYYFNNFTFQFICISGIASGLNLLISNFENVKISNTKEFESFGDRISNMMTFM